MGKKKGKKQDDEKKAALQARKDAKSDKAARKRLAKQQSKEGGGAVDVGEDELDQVLLAYKTKDKEQREHQAVAGRPTLEPIETPFPLPRANATLEFNGDFDKKDYFYLFGGEYFDGVENVILDQLLRYEVDKNEWKEVVTSPRPSPRCAHSCVSYKQNLYVFGGEMSSGDNYHHYRDLWKFDLKKLEWSEIVARNSPSARSGHAAVVWKNFMIIFGGFFEAKETKFYNDVQVFNLQTETWLELPQSRLAARPEPRSACNVALFGNDKIVIHGGFTKVPKNADSYAETNVYNDTWVLNLAPLLQEKAPTWERWMSSAKGISDDTTTRGRAGCSSVSYKNRMIVFGGVVDSEQLHHKVDSIFFNDLVALDIERRKWFSLRVKEKASGNGGRRRRKPKTDDPDDNEKVDDEDNDDESESSDIVEQDEDDASDAATKPAGWDLNKLRENCFAFVDGSGNLVYEKIDEEDEKKEESDDEGEEKEEEKEEENSDSDDEEEEKQEEKDLRANEKAAKKITASSVMILNEETNTTEAVVRTEPLPRINATALVRGNTLYLLGGILEVGDREVTLDDMWSLDLKKREQWHCIFPGTMHKQVWRGAVHDDDDSYISTGREDSDGEGDDMSDEEEDQETSKSRRAALREEIKELVEKYDIENENRTPNPDEALADFYSRTSDYWNKEVAKTSSDELSAKEIKREGFSMARDRFDDLKPILERLTKLSLQAKESKKKEKDSKSSKKSKKKDKH